MFDQTHLDKVNEALNDLRGKIPPGPWTNEPDRVEFVYNGYQCLIQRSPGSFGLCGYVGVPLTHPIAHTGKDLIMESVGLEVHGGVTYNSECSGHICHKVAEGEDDNLFWIGFDCAHAGDIMPMTGMISPDSPLFTGKDTTFNWGISYKTIEYVTHEIKSLADQLRARAA